MSKVDEKTVKVIIPFRDRGTDLRRGANLEVVMAWWWAHNIEPVVVDDGLEGDAQFNRHKAYNDAVSGNDADVYVFTEADMILDPRALVTGCRLALRKNVLVVPFRRYNYMSDETTAMIRDAFADWPSEKLAEWIEVSKDGKGIFGMEPESTMLNGKSIGAVNIVSRATLDVAGGFTEATHGNWYDDRITEEGFSFLTGNRTQYVPGTAVHLYHLPGHQGAHLSEEDRAATEHNRLLLHQMRSNIRQRRPEPVFNLMAQRLSDMTGSL